MNNHVHDPLLHRIRQSLSGRSRGIITQCADTRVTAVLVPLVQLSGGEWAVLFERRALSLRRQPGEVSFPGGHWEATDVDERATALRETCEELQTSPENIEFLADLDVLATWSGLLVYPFLGWVRHPEKLKPNPSEVAELFTVPLKRLLETEPKVYDLRLHPQPADDFPFHLVPGGREYHWRKMVARQLFYEMDGRVIWGMTARILNHFLELIR
jgi:coenzyme A diphosphatase NUDT7